MCLSKLSFFNAISNKNNGLQDSESIRHSDGGVSERIGLPRSWVPKSIRHSDGGVFPTDSKLTAHADLLLISVCRVAAVVNSRSAQPAEMIKFESAVK